MLDVEPLWRSRFPREAPAIRVPRTLHLDIIAKDAIPDSRGRNSLVCGLALIRLLVCGSTKKKVAIQDCKGG